MALRTRIFGVSGLIQQAVNAAAPTAAVGLQQKASYMAATSILSDILAHKIPQEQERLKTLRKELGGAPLASVAVEQVIGGMRGIPGMLWETSQLDENEGIRFRGYTIPQIQELLPKALDGGEPMAEGMMWLLLTGEIPTKEEAALLSSELRSRASIPPQTHMVMSTMPPNTHPMTQLCVAVASMQLQSRFAEAYSEGIHKADYWRPWMEDTLDLVAKLPSVAAFIYKRTYKGGTYTPPHPKLDWAANFAHQMGYTDPTAHELFRMYLTIHADHEGGNVSAHATHLVASALSDPYLSFTAGMTGLAGPLHGLANQEVLSWIHEMVQQVGENPSTEDVKQYVQKTLASGKVVPGYGHAVLRVTDPRFLAQQRFAAKHLPDDPYNKLVLKLYDVVPDVLRATGKVKNPLPNVDAYSGTLLRHVGLTEQRFYTVIFGVSRAVGVLSQGVWSRALGLPIERPKSLTMDSLRTRATK